MNGNYYVAHFERLAIDTYNNMANIINGSRIFRFQEEISKRVGKIFRVSIKFRPTGGFGCEKESRGDGRGGGVGCGFEGQTIG